MKLADIRKELLVKCKHTQGYEALEYALDRLEYLARKEERWKVIDEGESYIGLLDGSLRDPMYSLFDRLKHEVEA